MESWFREYKNIYAVLALIIVLILISFGLTATYKLGAKIGQDGLKVIIEEIWYGKSEEETKNGISS